MSDDSRFLVTSLLTLVGYKEGNTDVDKLANHGITMLTLFGEISLVPLFSKIFSGTGIVYRAIY